MAQAEATNYYHLRMKNLTEREQELPSCSVAIRLDRLLVSLRCVHTPFHSLIDQLHHCVVGTC